METHEIRTSEFQPHDIWGKETNCKYQYDQSVPETGQEISRNDQAEDFLGEPKLLYETIMVNALVYLPVHRFMEYTATKVNSMGNDGLWVTTTGLCKFVGFSVIVAGVALWQQCVANGGGCANGGQNGYRDSTFLPMLLWTQNCSENKHFFKNFNSGCIS